MTYIKVNNTLYPATIDGRIADYEWDKRSTKSITLTMSYEDVLALLPDNTPWSIVQKGTTLNAEGVEEEYTNEYDNADYSMSGAVTDNRDGTVTIKMGKPTEIENVLAELETEVANG